MDWVAHTFSTFGQSIGIPNLEFDQDGSAQFGLEPNGSLSFLDLQNQGGNEVLITMSRPLTEPRSASLRVALQWMDFRACVAEPIQLSLLGDELRATIRIPRPSFTVNVLSETVKALFDFHTKLANAF